MVLGSVRGNQGQVIVFPTYTPEALLWMQVSASFLVFVRSLDPDERLDVNHVARGKILQVAADRVRKVQEACVSVPHRARLVAKVESVFACGGARHHWLQKYVHPRTRDESEHSHDRPREHARLLSR